METRKLQQVGGGTYTVSIPKPWIEDQGLETGETVHLYPHHDHSLLLRAEKKDDEGLARTCLHVDCDGPAALRRTVRGAHAAGFDSVTLTAAGEFDEAARRAVSEATRDLVGMEIVNEGAKEITVQTLLDGSDFSVRQSVVQLQYVATSSIGAAVAALSEADETAAERLRDRATEANRLFDALTRHVNRTLTSFEALDSLGISRVALFDYAVTARHLKRIVEHARTLGGIGSELSEPLPKSLAGDLDGLCDRIVTVVEDATTAVLDGRASDAHVALESGTSIETSIEGVHTALQREPGECPAAVLAAVSRGGVHLSAFLASGCAIAEVAIRAETRSDHAQALGSIA